MFNEGQGVGSFLFSLLLALIMFFIAKRAGYFRLPKTAPPLSPKFRQTVGAFIIYPLVALILLPLIYVLTSYVLTGSFTGLKSKSGWVIGWLQLVGLWIVFVCLLSYCFLIRRENLNAIIWGGQKKSAFLLFKTMGMGILTWGISYPFVLFLGLIGKWISLSIWGVSGVDQVAVRQLKMTMGHPILFSLMIFTIIVIVPFLEELLFRGFLQSWLRKYLGRLWAIILTSLIFAIVHFAPSQGTGNFELILSISALSFFLGFIYERERTLWAPWGLHMAFNAISISAILYSS